MNESYYFGGCQTMAETVNQIKANICEDYMTERISTVNLAKRYNLTEDSVLQIVDEVFPHDSIDNPDTLVYMSMV